MRDDPANGETPQTEEVAEDFLQRMDDSCSAQRTEGGRRSRRGTTSEAVRTCRGFVIAPRTPKLPLPTRTVSDSTQPLSP